MFNKNQYIRDYNKELYKNLPIEKKKQLQQKLRLKKAAQRAQVIKEMGNKCPQCGYNKYPTLLEFHHKTPRNGNKELFIPWGCSWQKVRETLKGCELLCANCHAEVHYLYLEKDK